VEKRRASTDLPAAAEPSVSLAEWLEGDGEELVRRYDRLYVPRNDPRYLRRNALVALGNVGSAADAPLAMRYAESDDDLLREHAEWALRRLGGSRRRLDGGGPGAQVPASPAPERES
jgi:epoxyqueuosine reductase